MSSKAINQTFVCVRLSLIHKWYINIPISIIGRCGTYPKILIILIFLRFERHISHGQSKRILSIRVETSISSRFQFHHSNSKSNFHFFNFNPESRFIFLLRWVYQKIVSSLQFLQYGYKYYSTSEQECKYQGSNCGAMFNHFHRLWQIPHIWLGADDFSKRVCPDSMESFELALTVARLYANETKNEYHYRFFMS